MKHNDEKARIYALTGPQAYELMAAALALVSSASPTVHARLRRDKERGRNSSRPTVHRDDLLALVDVLNRIEPGIADDVIRDRAKAIKQLRGRSG